MPLEVIFLALTLEGSHFIPFEQTLPLIKTFWMWILQEINLLDIE